MLLWGFHDGKGVRMDGGRAHVVRKCIPMLLINQRDDAAWGFGGAAVIFTLDLVNIFCALILDFDPFVPGLVKH